MNIKNIFCGSAFKDRGKKRWFCQAVRMAEESLESGNVMEALTIGAFLGYLSASDCLQTKRQGMPNIYRVIQRVRRKYNNKNRLLKPEQNTTPIRFCVDSIFLAAAARYLLRPDIKKWDFDLVERFHYATGGQIDDRTYTINHIIPVDYAKQSCVYLSVDDSSNINQLAKLDSWGVPLVAHFHSHPSNGPEANHPSGIDRSFQERLERGGHVAIGGIFSQDGYLRFFAGDDSRFQISIFGNHVKEISKNVYRIDMASEDLPIVQN
jgi:hypothetical protein